MGKLTLLITQILQSDIFIGIVGKDLILFSMHTCRLAVMLNVGYLQGFGWAPTPFKDVTSLHVSPQRLRDTSSIFQS